MNSGVKRYLFRVSLLAICAIAMGSSLSYLVYNANEKVKVNAIDLVESRLPILISINQLIADLNEQERIVYEYYRSQDRDIFQKDFKNINQTILMHSQELNGQTQFRTESAFVLQQQENIMELAQRFDNEMGKDPQNWDYLRELLTNITDVRLSLLPTLYHVEKNTKKVVNKGHLATLNEITNTRFIIILYVGGIIFFAGVIFWYIKQYVQTNAKNTRLALFSQRNPNPILSVNNLGDIVFSNPACVNILNKSGYSASDLSLLLPSNFPDVRRELSKRKSGSMILEQPLKNHILQINVNWLKEVDAYDIHIHDITKRKLAEQSVNHLAFYAQETNLPNQYKLNTDVDEKIDERATFTLAFFEVKDFTQLVSTLGGETVSELVKVMVKVLLKALPSGINLYQLNDRQFSLLSSKALSPSASFFLTTKLLEQAEKPLMAVGGEFFVELDFGYCNFPEHGENRNILYKNAHTALSMSVVDDHIKYSLFKNEYAEEIEKKASLIDKLRHALEKEELYLVFQPQLDLKKHRITGIETLVRWKHKGDVISPSQFIPLSEQSGLIVPIGQWILMQSCILAKKLITQGYKDIVIAVNVSPRQFSHPNFFKSVVKALKESELPPENLELEITEGVVMHNEESTLSVLHQLKALGVHLSIDDFGTGYSSLSYLKRFPVDKLKIDQSFVFDCHENHEDRAIVNTIVSLGKNLGLTLIAEGVEELAHVEFLSSLGCDEIQGYWYSKPLEEESLIAFLEKEYNSVSLNVS